MNRSDSDSDTGYILGKRGDFDAALSHGHKALAIRAAHSRCISGARRKGSWEATNIEIPAKIGGAVAGKA
jgi:hypothetical protein